MVLRNTLKRNADRFFLRGMRFFISMVGVFDVKKKVYSSMTDPILTLWS